ncbi:hypothetical protein RCO48_17555 [Peribacillus frigoritolerans]|nr:hypothetical protein [Peribacillus frigoritolerans]
MMAALAVLILLFRLVAASDGAGATATIVVAAIMVADAIFYDFLFPHYRNPPISSILA